MIIKTKIYSVILSERSDRRIPLSLMTLTIRFLGIRIDYMGSFPGT